MLKDILKRAAVITWKNRYLWIFGFFAAFMASGTGEVNLLTSSIERVSEQTLPLAGLRLREPGLLGNVMANLKTLATSPYFLPFLLVGLAVLTFFIWLAVLSQVGLIHSCREISQGRKSTLRDGWGQGIKLFWPAFGVNVIGKLVSFGLLSLLGLPLASLYLSGKSEALAIILTLILFIIFIPLAIIISFITRFALCFVTLKRKKVLSSFLASLQLFKNHWLKTIGLALLLVLASLGLGIALAILMVAAGLPFFVLIFVFSRLAWTALAHASLILAILLLGAILFVGGAIFSAFEYNSWTLFFLKLRETVSEKKVKDNCY